MKSFVRGGLVLVLGSALGLGSFVLASEEGIDGRKAQLDELKREIGDNRDRIESLRQKEEETARVQNALDKDRKLTHRYLTTLLEQERALRQDHALRQAEVLDLGLESDEAAKRLKERLRRYYRLRHVSGAELVFSSSSFHHLLARSQFLVRMIRRDQLDLKALSQTRSRIVVANETLRSRQGDISRLLADKRAEEQRLESQGADLAQEIAELKDEREEHQRRLQQLQVTEVTIQKMIAQLERARARAGVVDLKGDFAADKGKLLWPVEGEILAEFGFTVHPRYKTKVPNNGIIIQARAGTLIGAAAAGRVEFVGWYDGYGRTVILNHGDGFYSIYAHASKIRVVAEDRVDAGHVIAEVGDTDSLRGNCLHFEIRRQAQALDPRDWLR